MIKIKNLNKSYDMDNILTDINLNISKGQIYGLMGQSGAGKSTLLRCINGLENFDSGELLVADTNLKHISKNDLRVFRKKIGMIFQDFALMSRRNVLENVALPMECWNYSPMEIKKKSEALLDLVGILHKKNSMPSELSGGQKQRVAIARALSLNPEILLCDEATSALDPNTTDSILNLLSDINKEMGITIVLVTHEVDVIKNICDRAAIISKGRIVANNTVEDIFLKESEALYELIGKKILTIPKNHKIIKLSARNDDVQSNFIWELSTQNKTKLSIVSANIEQYKNKSFGHLYISVHDNEIESALKYCSSKKIDYELITENMMRE
ncbi:methionine ABC transporter ATP-binding protein [Acetoanaerobium noterae]|uniref:methionine ABC transporter ATP-binding protein n=1 Tax=Acetoanaerobium noterae TaxID=745369 RepID=UPI00332D7AA0